jgi:uncharacterized membrane protein
MDPQLIIGLLLSVLPVFEIRGGLPLIVDYALREGISIWPYFFMALTLNILVIFLIFLFLDFLHESFMNLRTYRHVIGKVLKRVHKKAEKVGKKFEELEYISLFLFVSIPLPGSGAWSGALISWILGLDRKKSFVAIALGVAMSGLLVLLLSLGFFNWFY